MGAAWVCVAVAAAPRDVVLVAAAVRSRIVGSSSRRQAAGLTPKSLPVIARSDLRHSRRIAGSS